MTEETVIHSGTGKQKARVPKETTTRKEQYNGADASLDAVLLRLARMETRLDGRLHGIEKRQDDMNARLSSIDTQLLNLIKEQASLTERQIGMNEMLNKLDTRERDLSKGQERTQTLSYVAVVLMGIVVANLLLAWIK